MKFLRHSCSWLLSSTPHCGRGVAAAVEHHSFGITASAKAFKEKAVLLVGGCLCVLHIYLSACDFWRWGMLRHLDFSCVCAGRVPVAPAVGAVLPCLCLVPWWHRVRCDACVVCWLDTCTVP